MSCTAPTPPTPTPTAIPEPDTFCSDMVAVSIDTHKAMSELEEHIIEGRQNQDRINDPYWRDSVEPLLNDLYDPSILYRDMAYSEVAEYLRPTVDQLADTMDMIAVLYREAVFNYDIEQVVRVHDAISEFANSFYSIQRSLSGLCGDLLEYAP